MNLHSNEWYQNKPDATIFKTWHRWSFINGTMFASRVSRAITIAFRVNREPEYMYTNMFTFDAISIFGVLSLDLWEYQKNSLNPVMGIVIFYDNSTHRRPPFVCLFSILNQTVLLHVPTRILVEIM